MEKQLANIIPIVKKKNKSPALLKPATRRSKVAEQHHAINSSTELIDRVGELSIKKKNAEAEYRRVLGMLQATFSAQVVDMEQDGECVTTLACDGLKYKFKITRKNQYSKIDIGEEVELQSALGDDLYYDLIVEKVEIKLNENVDVELLEQIITEAGHNPDDFFSTRRYLTLHNETIQKTANLRGTICKSQQSYVDELISTLQYKPSVSIVKEQK